MHMCTFSLRAKSWLSLCLAAGCLNLVAGYAGPNEEAQTLLNRVLQTNQPWLAPRPLQGHYLLSRQRAGSGTIESIGPCYMINQDNPTSYFASPASRYADRVGSLVWTPLHDLYQQAAIYTLSAAGTNDWHGVPVVAIDLAFDPWIRGQIGFGGQAPMLTSYSASNYRVTSARLLIEPTQAVPLQIETHDDSSSGPYDVTWEFDSNFLAVDGGLAPRAFEWNEPDFCRERQEFELFEHEWVFQKGQAWWGENQVKTR